jgi:squalene-hopene/tetraprenyl-beta-curcumene cyclase
VPLSVIRAHRPVTPLPPELGVSELAEGAVPPTPRPMDLEERAFRAAFLALDRALKRMEGGWRPLRRRALARAERWMLERMDHSDGLGAIFPPIVHSIIALRCLGYPLEHPRVRAQLAELERLEVDDGDVTRVQPCVGAVWDTALSLRALAETAPAGSPPEPRLADAARWLLAREVRRPGDWRARAPGVEPGGWAFEDRNPFYPDCDDTAEVLSALSALRAAGLDAGAVEPRRRAVAWLLAMQNDDGGWGAFDRGCDRRFLTYVPYADHNAMLDPSSEDITGRAIEALVGEGLPVDHRAIVRARRFLLSRRQPDGTWYGRWGANHLYGTFLALRGLRAAGEDLRAPRHRATAAWIRRMQNADGGWGETLESYEHPGLKGRGETTAAQTAWALLALLELGDHDSEAVRAGVARLLASQDERGGWLDGPWTGTGFPRVFYLRYALYDDHFPLLALGRYRERRRASRGTEES